MYVAILRCEEKTTGIPNLALRFDVRPVFIGPRPGEHLQTIYRVGQPGQLVTELPDNARIGVRSVRPADVQQLYDAPRCTRRLGIAGASDATDLVRIRKPEVARLLLPSSQT